VVTEEETAQPTDQALAAAESEAATEAVAEAAMKPRKAAKSTRTTTGSSAASARPRSVSPAGSPTPDGTVRADHVELKQGGAARIEATSVTLTQGGASRINARDVSISQGGAGLVRTETLRLGTGSSAGAVLAGRAELAKGSRIMVLVARQTSGDVRPILDWRGVLALVGGIVLLRRLLGALRQA